MNVCTISFNRSILQFEFWKGRGKREHDQNPNWTLLLCFPRISLVHYENTFQVLIETIDVRVKLDFFIEEINFCIIFLMHIHNTNFFWFFIYYVRN